MIEEVRERKRRKIIHSYIFKKGQQQPKRNEGRLEDANLCSKGMKRRVIYHHTFRYFSMAANRSLTTTLIRSSNNLTPIIKAHL
ncbi:hypothetical protein X798_04839 [Onchocerca flexuosa]|uniref:Uncharacterized protein n=1 Tax=Onchocerca flexuosa TaxID=387005 RepID=A0A238BTD5_9BILA|nr:hypothetical protein X798_04839 [Onchocerca flexuosa]